MSQMNSPTITSDATYSAINMITDKPSGSAQVNDVGSVECAPKLIPGNFYTAQLPIQSPQIQIPMPQQLAELPPNAPPIAVTTYTPAPPTIPKLTETTSNTCAPVVIPEISNGNAHKQVLDVPASNPLNYTKRSPSPAKWPTQVSPVKKATRVENGEPPAQIQEKAAAVEVKKEEVGLRTLPLPDIAITSQDEISPPKIVTEHLDDKSPLEAAVKTEIKMTPEKGKIIETKGCEKVALAVAQDIAGPAQDIIDENPLILVKMEQVRNSPMVSEIPKVEMAPEIPRAKPVEIPKKLKNKEEGLFEEAKKVKKKQQAPRKSHPVNKAESSVGGSTTRQVEEIKKGPKQGNKKRKLEQAALEIESDSGEGRKSHRMRLPTQMYQSPLPEMQLIQKMTTAEAKTSQKEGKKEKIIAFYRNEFLAVRNPEGSYYICQAFQNIYRTSTRIKIRWFTQHDDYIFSPDFWDTVEFDCILTNVKLSRSGKERFKLPEKERLRVESILKRALDVEKGVANQPSVTEEHPDGLDLSLYKSEEQLNKPKPKVKMTSYRRVKKKESTSKKCPIMVTKVIGTKRSPRLNALASELSVIPVASSSSLATAAAKARPMAVKSPRNFDKGKPSAGLRKSARSEPPKTNKPKVAASHVKKQTMPPSKEISSKNLTPKRPALSARVEESAIKRKKEEPAKSSSQAERLGKIRNAGPAVSAKINSAASTLTKGRNMPGRKK